MEGHQFGYKSMPECVMEYLKKQLTTKKLKPGDEINLTAISSTLGISRTPIREALIQLVKDGLVELVSRRKFIIKKLTLDDIKYLYSLVGLLEAEAAKPSCVRMTEEEIANLEDLYRGMEEALRKDEVLTYLELNSASHAVITKYCENPILLEMLNNIKERLNIIIYDFPKVIMSIPEWESLLMSDHAKMIRAIRSKDQEALGWIIKDEHWDFARNYPYLLKYYEIFYLKTFESSLTRV